jgi:hypothetical protein
MRELKQVEQIMTELGDLARELDVLARAAYRVTVRRDVDSLWEIAERMMQGHVRWAELYRTPLAANAGTGRSTSPGARGVGRPELRRAQCLDAVLGGPGDERSSPGPATSPN